MDLESVELSRDRAVSSEPCSTRPNPFNDHEPSARKRQRVSSGGSRSRSVDAARDTTITPDSSASPGALSEMDTLPQPPQTPTRPAKARPAAEPTSSRVTINLRSTRPLVSHSSSPTSPTPAKMAVQAADTKMSIEASDEDVVIDPAVETPQSSSSAGGSPEIEVVNVVDDDADYGRQALPVAIIDDDELLLDSAPDPMTQFPFTAAGELLSGAVRKISKFLEFDLVETDECFCKLRDWIASFLQFYSTREESWYENYINYQDFWEQFPDIIWSLSKRRSYFGQFLHKSKDGRQALSDLLSQFARLTAHFVLLDVKALPRLTAMDDSTTEPALASRPYLLAFSWLLRKEEIPHIGRNLEQHYRWNWSDDTSMMMNNFIVGGGTIDTLTNFTQQLLLLIPRFPKLIEQLTDPGRIVYRAVTDAAMILTESEDSYPQYIETYQQMIVQSYKYYKVMAPGLAFIIDKHVTSLTPDAAMIHIVGLTNVFYCSLTYEPRPAHEVFKEHRLKYPSLPPVFSFQVISNEWKFEMLRKLIVSAQMQLRVIGVTSMCADLLSLFTKNKRDDPTTHPLLLHFAALILRNKLVDYIVGIGSHPEIISESGNIIGFLVATKTYSHEQTDTIWHTVMTSQDPRVVEAILRMLRQILNLYQYEPLLYLCKKVGELPIEAFTLPMREYTDQLLRHIVERRSYEGPQTIDAPPFELCVRLMRESSISRPDAPSGLLEIQAFATTKLKDLISHGPERDVRQSIYISCIDDIARRSLTSSGSICALFGVLRHNLSLDLPDLTTKHGLTRLMVEELERNSSREQNSSFTLGTNSPARLARRELLLAIIIHEPSTINDKLGSRLWDLLVGEEAQSGPEREVGWQILNAAARKAPGNIFVTTCFKDHLPKLDPKAYTLGSLDFAREAITAWMNEANGDLLDEIQHPTNGGIEQLWRMILRAPPNSIEAPAINTMVELYLDSVMILRMPRSRAHSVHLSLVSRCLSQMSSAANKIKSFNDGNHSGDDDSMVIVPTDNQVREQQLIFTRSLILLREFLRSHQSKPHFASSKPKSPILNVTGELIGEPLDVKYQTFDGDVTGHIGSLSIGNQNSVATLFLSVKNATGFKNCKIYHWGKEINIDDTDLHASLQELKIGMGLLLVQRRDGDEISEERLRVKSSTIEYEIIQHSDDLWNYLGMEEKLAKEIYYFLIKFPVYEKLVTAFEEESTSCSVLFPVGQPYKCMYAIYAIREHLAQQLKDGIVNTEFRSRAIGLIVAAINTPEIIEICPSEDTRCFMGLQLTECLTQLLKEPVPVESLTNYLDTALLERLLEILADARTKPGVPNSVQLVASTFEAILETSFHSPTFWHAFRDHQHIPQLLFELLLQEPRIGLRKVVMKQIGNRIDWASSLSTLSTIEFSMALWPLVKELIPQAVKQPYKCEETLSLALQFFRKLADTSIHSVNIEECLLEWGSLLLEHRCLETVGHLDLVDPVARCLASLLYWCASCAKASQQRLPPNTLAIQLLDKHLFSELAKPSEADTIVERLPILDTVTRKLISDTIIFLTKDDEDQYKQVMEHLDYLLPYNEGDHNDPYAYDLPLNFERSKLLRSSTGYVGLHNLSNTCYLNSLFTQLFMNISFRRFMLDAYVADPTAQKLLQETQKLFSYMQNTLKKFVDPANLASSIRTYDEASIDVSIQMDVDEFYNLLFDRWESQILSVGAKRTFRSFYGGQLVQQVKSKECPHISERLEPFSAIQCDIKGKTSLQESLQAYVDGEVMEGDNKYKCSTCDRHVNAVKRACLKDIPDNLIFHLKRFDFNLRTMQRNKINDYFSFPHKIDMRPYKVEHLMETAEETSEDIFELVGILVHSGTAESGHYYSYIRERPSWGQVPSWVEFNDENVSSFDPSSIEASCFGGVDYRGPDGGSFQFDKSWSAYMLFYQRSSVLQAQQEELSTSILQPVRCDIDRTLSKFIVQENEQLIRKYCLYDEGHASFVLRMMENVQHINKGRCSDDHTLESIALRTTLSNLDQVVARTKDIPDFPSYMMHLSLRIQACGECSCDILEYWHTHVESLRQALLRNSEQLVRNETGMSIVLALKKVRQTMSPSTYGLYDDASDNDDEWERDFNPRVFYKIMETLHRFWESFHVNTKAWPEFFALLANMAELGLHETAVFLDFGFLKKVLEVICADHALTQHPQYTRMLNVVNKRAKPVSYDNIIALLEVLLKACDFTVDPTSYENEKRLDTLIDAQCIPISKAEELLLIQHWERSNINILTEKLLLINQNERSTLSIITMLMSEPEIYPRHIFNAIRSGIGRKASSVQAVRPFLRAALVFCELTKSRDLMCAIIDHISDCTRVLDGTEGKDYLQFFRDISSIDNNAGVSRAEFFRYVIDQIPVWAPRLLAYYDPVVRTDTEDYIQQLLHRYSLVGENHSQEAKADAAAVFNIARKLGISCLHYLQDEHIRPKITVVKANVLSIQAVIELCKPYYDATVDEELTMEFRELFPEVILQTRRLIVEEQDEDVSEWEGSDDAFSSSEVMESIAEIGGDLHETDASL